ncbi:Myotubularin protein 13 [Fasciola gigantica]|uniref:Myotubularin protein 13 n=1 Tax=Fasciola gigantica TaxID=46835 RepID=A0A504YGQ1_FASGI|nr:Myotubularin protein 13 [Fasciola gigantica]
MPNMSPSEAINDLANNTDRCLHEQRALLTWEQFELIVDLLDEALCQESQSEDTGIAPIVMELSTKFCTQLNNVRYYANMTHQIQRHHVWEQMSFWESVFNEHVNSQIRQLYIHFSEQEQQQQQYNQQRSLSSSHQGDNNIEKSFGPSPNENGMSPSTDTQKGERVITVGIRRKFQPSYTANMSALEIAAEEMRLVNSRPADVQQSLEVQEESTVYAQIIHFINLIVNFRIPVDVGAAAASVYGDPSALNNFTGTVDSNHVDYTVNMHDTAFGSTHRAHQKENGIISDGDRSTVDVGSNWRPRYTDLVDRLPISSGHPTSRHPSPGDL